jgi:hypothetical protein
MNHSTSMNSKKRPLFSQRDTIETDANNSLTGLGSSIAKNTVDSFKQIGSGMFDQLFGLDNQGQEQQAERPFAQQEQKQQPKRLESRNLFNMREIEERRQIEAIKELIKQIKKEVDMIQKADKALMSEVQDIQKLAIDSSDIKPGIYHMRFLEVVLRILQSLRSKISESRMWMDALVSKKKKRGSLFASRAKKQGTQYSMSQELSNARSVQ